MASRYEPQVQHRDCGPYSRPIGQPCRFRHPTSVHEHQEYLVQNNVPIIDVSTKEIQGILTFDEGGVPRHLYPCGQICDRNKLTNIRALADL